MNSDKNQYTIRNCLLGFKCDANWNLMNIVRTVPDFEGGTSEVRFCNGCQKEVFESNSDDELTDNIRSNRCVSFLRLDNAENRLLGYFIKSNE